MNERAVESLQKEMREKGIEIGLFISSERPDPNMIYLAGYEGEGSLIVPANGSVFLLVSQLEEEYAKKNLDIDVRVLKDKIYDYLNFKKIGIDFDRFFVGDVEKVKKEKGTEFFDLSEILKRLRRKKSKQEIDLVREACKITDEIFKEFSEKVRGFKSEREAVVFLEGKARLYGCGLSFVLIVASGANASMPHHRSNGNMEKGFCVVDFGVRYKGYCSDVTRTFFIGKAGEKDKKIYNNFLNVQKKAISDIKEGVKVRDLYNGVKSVLGKEFIHSLGHSLGIECHDGIVISDKSEDVLEENEIITIEPGIYKNEKYGIRIEDDVLVLKEGSEVLTKFSKEFIEIN